MVPNSLWSRSVFKSRRLPCQEYCLTRRDAFTWKRGSCTPEPAPFTSSAADAAEWVDVARIPLGPLISGCGWVADWCHTVTSAAQRNGCTRAETSGRGGAESVFKTGTFGHSVTPPHHACSTGSNYSAVPDWKFCPFSHYTGRKSL